MAKKASITEVTNTFDNTPTINANFTAIQLAGSSIYATPKAGGSVSPMNTAKWNLKFEAWA